MTNERTVTVKELNRNAGKVVKSVATSGPVKITYHGDVIALLVPVSAQQTTWERMVEEGTVMQPNSREPWLPEPVQAASGRTSQQILDELKGSR